LCGEQAVALATESFLWVVQARHGQAYTVDHMVLVKGEARSATLTGLDSGTHYFISVKCYNSMAEYCGIFDYELSARTSQGKSCF